MKQRIEAAVERAIPPEVQVKGEETFSTLDERMRATGVPGVSIAVFMDYEIVWAKGYGVADKSNGRRVDKNTLFQAASISKPVNALAILIAAADGALAMDAPINSQLKSWKLPDNPLTQKTPVTLKMLLTHTAGTTVHGFRGYATGAKIPTTTDVLDGTGEANSPPVRVDIPPGSEFRYSGGGVTISQLALVDNVDGTYAEILKRTVLEPLTMTRSTFAQPLPAALLDNAAAGTLRNGEILPTKRHVYPEIGAAGLWTTPSDLARFFLEIANARNGRPSSIERSIAEALTTPAIEQDDPSSAIGIGTFLKKQGDQWMFGHGGANEGFQAIANASRDGGFGYVIMTNSDIGSELANEIERALLNLDGWPGKPPIERIALDAKARANIVGRYVAKGATFPFVVATDADKLTISRPFDKPTELVPTKHGLVSRVDGARFEPDPEGGRFTIRSPRNGRVLEAKRLPDDVSSPLLLLEKGDTAGALLRWKEIAHSEPDSPIVREAPLNALGYDLLGRKGMKNALTVFRFIVAANPTSSNAHDSLGEALALSGDTAAAIAAYEASLAKLDADESVPAGEKAARRAHGEAQLTKLRATK